MRGTSGASWRDCCFLLLLEILPQSMALWERYPTWGVGAGCFWRQASFTVPQRPDGWGTASGATVTPYAQGHLCSRTRKLSSCPQKPAMCMSSLLGLLVECPFRDIPKFPVCFCSSQLPITLSKRSYSPIPESPIPSLFCSLQCFSPQDFTFVFLVFPSTQ